MGGSVAICFVVANPHEETRTAWWERRIRAWLQEIPFLGERVAPLWSPRRRVGYGAGLRACVNSLRRHHAALPPIIVLRPEGEGPTLADVDEVRSFDPAPYAAIPSMTSYWGSEIFYKLAVFALGDFERVVYLDCDTLVLGDVSALWDLEQYDDADVYGVRESRDMGSPASMVGKVNTGVLVLNRRPRSPEIHRKLIEIAHRRTSYDGSDQGVFHQLMEESPQLRVGELDPSYNVIVLWKKRGRWEQIEDRVRILHFVNSFKPWTPYHARDPFFDAEFKRLWDDAFRSAIADATDQRPPGAGTRAHQSAVPETSDRSGTSMSTASTTPSQARL